MPLFRKRKQAGWTALKLTSDGICHAHVVRRAGGRPLVSDWGCAVVDLQSPSAVKALSDAHGWNAQHCAVLLDRAEYQLLQVDALSVPKPEQRQAIRWSIKDMLDYPVTNATVDVLEIPGDPAMPARQRYMFAVAARNEVILSRMQRFNERTSSGLEAIDIPELAQRNFASFLEQEGRGLALLSFGDDGGLLTFTSGGELYHARQIDITFDQIQTADPERRSHKFERVALDLQRSLDNFERQFPYVTVGRLMLAPFPGREALLEYLRSYLYLQVETFELTDIFELGPGVELDGPEMQSKGLLVLGAALRDEGGR